MQIWFLFVLVVVLTRMLQCVPFVAWFCVIIILNYFEIFCGNNYLLIHYLNM